MPIINFDKARIESGIVTLAKTERITKKVLSELSRTLVAYVYETGDVSLVNRTIQVLTPVNKRVACLYFPTYIGWSFDEKTCMFGKKAKDKTYNKKLELATAYLEDEGNDIWRYAEDEIQLQAKPKNYGAKLTQLVTKALTDEDEGLSAKEVLFAILASEELTLADLMQPLAEIKEAPLEEVA
jgi:transcriptional/translational regulatory protein YebC/TACO1